MNNRTTKPCLLAGIVVVTALLAGCAEGADRSDGSNLAASVQASRTSAEPDEPPKSVSASSGPALDAARDVGLDPKSGQITFPFERFLMTEYEQRTIAAASGALRAVCAQSGGVDFRVAPSRYDPVYDSEHFFGPWTLAQAEEFGWVDPMTQADLIANGYLRSIDSANASSNDAPNAHLTEDDWSIIEKCDSRPELERFAPEALTVQGPWLQRALDVEAEFGANPDVERIREEVVSCYERRGFARMAEGEWEPAGIRFDEISEEQIRMAISFVECKDDIQATERLAQMLAEAQAPIIEEYADELVAQRKNIDEAVDAAEEYIAAHPEAFLPE